MIKLRLSQNLIRDLLIGVALGVLLGAILAPFGFAPASTQAGQPITVQDVAASSGDVKLPLTAQSTADNVLALMRQSYQHWHTFDGIAATTHYDEQTNKKWTVTDHAQVEQSGKVRLETALAEAAPTYVFTNDGTTVVEEDRGRGVYTQYPTPANARALDKWGPPAAPNAVDRFVVPHPLEGLIPSMLGGYIFPVGLGQSLQPEEVSVLGEEVIAGRPAVLIRWQVERNGEIGKKHLYWIDASTGLILKAEIYGNSKNNFSFLSEQTVFLSAQYDQSVNTQIFSAHPATQSRLLTVDQFEDLKAKLLDSTIP